MSNNIELNKVLADYSTSFAARYPIKELANTKVEAEFGDSTGDTIYVKSRGYGKTYQTTDLTGKMSDIEVVGVPVKLLPYKKGASASFIENTLELGEDGKEVLAQMASEMVDTLAISDYATALYGASNAIVGSGTFAELSRAITNVKKVGQGGKIGSMLSFDMRNAITNSSATQNFVAAPRMAEKYFDGVIGDFNGASVIEGRTDLIETLDLIPAGATLTVTSAGVATITPSGAVSATVAAGTIFKVAGISCVDELGKSIGVNRVFCLHEEAVFAGAGAVTVNIGEIFATGPRKNVSALPSASAITNLLEANSKYATGVVFSKDELIIVQKGIKPLKSSVSETVPAAAGMPIRMTYEGSAKVSNEEYIFDVLHGSKVYSQRAVSSLYTKLA